MAFSPQVSWSGGISSASGFNAAPAGSADPRQGDDRIRELKIALAERLSREFYFALVGSSSAGQEGNLRAGAGRIYHTSSAPTTKPDGNALDADDVGRLYGQSNTTPLRVRTSNSTWVQVAASPPFYSNTVMDIKMKVIPIGDWNMNSTASVSVAHGLTLSKIVNVSVVVRNDADDARYLLGPYYGVGSNLIDSGIKLDGTNVILVRGTYWTTSSIFNVPVFTGANFDATSYNRGFITIWYTP